MTYPRFLICAMLAGLVAIAVAADNPKTAVPSLPAGTKLYRMVVEHFWHTNCYFIVSPSGKAIVVDPGDDLEWTDVDFYRRTGKDAKRIFDFLEKNHYELKYILITHGHLDHIGSIKLLKEKFPNVIIMMHPADVRKVGDPLAGQPKDANLILDGLVKVDKTIDEGDIVTLDGMSLKVLYTPGHGRGSICFLTSLNNRPLLFSGDTLLHFYLGADGKYYDTGRTNFKDGTGDEVLLYRMIREKLFTLPDDTLVFPGHYDYTTIELEKQYSPALAVPERPVELGGPAGGDMPTKQE